MVELAYDLIVLGEGKYVHVSTADTWVDRQCGEINFVATYQFSDFCVRCFLIRGADRGSDGCLAFATDFVRVLRNTAPLN